MSKRIDFAAMSKAQLRKLLLAKPTLSDRAWAPARGVPPRNEGESRDPFKFSVMADGGGRPGYDGNRQPAILS